MPTTATGTIHFGTTLTVNVKDITVNQVGNTEDTSTFSDADAWKTFTATSKQWDGTANVVWSATNTFAISESGTLHCDITNGPDYSGTAIITGINSPMVKDGVMVQPVTFLGTGALTVA